jgi:hypothetical protein
MVSPLLRFVATRAHEKRAEIVAVSPTCHPIRLSWLGVALIYVCRLDERLFIRLAPL